MSTSAALGAGRPAVLIRGTSYPIVLPRRTDPRLHLALAIVSLQVLGQTALGFQLSIAQILVSVVTCAVLETVIVLRRERAFVWPASALLTGNGVAFILRVPGTEHGDWWSLHGAWIFAATAAAGLLSKYVVRVGGRHILNPSNAGLVLCFLVLGDARAQPLDFWWGPMSVGLVLAIAIIVVAGLTILARLRMLMIAAGFWVSFAAGVAVLAATGHSITARWHLGPISGWSFWWLLVSSPEILIFLFFMITDPKTAPSGSRARTTYAVAVGLVATLLIAPQTTEFATKVAVLGALTLVCIARPLLGRSLPLRARVAGAASSRIRVGALGLAGVAAYALVLVAAGLPARSESLPEGATMATAGGAGPAGIEVTVAQSRDVASSMPLPLARRIAQDVVTALSEEADALRTRDPARAAAAAAGDRLGELQRQIGRARAGHPVTVATYRIEQVRVALAAGPDQLGPRILATVRGTVAQATYAGSPPRLEGRTRAVDVVRTFELAATKTGYLIIGSRRVPVPSRAGSAAVPGTTAVVELEIGAAGPVPQGTPVPVRAVVRNSDAASQPFTVALSLTGPGGSSIRFHEAKLIVPGNGRAATRVAVTPSQWFSSLGTFRVVASVDGRPSGTPAVFAVSKPTVIAPRFEDVTKRAGLTTTMPTPSCGQFANGAAWGDVNGDGAPDLFLTRLSDPAQLFVSDGKGGFQEEAAARGVAVTDAIGAAFADYDNDGRPDLYIARTHADVLLRNVGSGHFENVTAAAGIRESSPSTGVAWGDYDNDGRLDIYVTSYITCLGAWTNPYALTSRVRYYPDTLYHNNGDGTFSAATSRLGRGATSGAGFGAAWFDYNGDNRQDLYLGNDFIGERPDHNHLWRNNGRAGGGKEFTDVSAQSDTALFNNTMGIAVGDFDRDLRLDLALSDIGAKKLLRNRGNGTFADIASSARVARPLQRSTVQSITWGVGSYDFNLDGWEDLYFAAGNVIRRPQAGGAQRNELYVNDGTGKHFLDLSAASGGDDAGDSKGVAFADYDGDGRVDIAVVDQGGPPRLYRNVTPREGSHWLEVDARGTVSSRDGCGARIVVRLGDGTRMLRQVYCSGNQTTVHFGLGRATTIAGLEISWPSGIRQTLGNVRIDRRITVTEPDR